MLKNYFTIAIRNLWKNKVFAAINLAGLALGMACSLGIFMIVRHESSFDTFHPGYKRIYRVVSEFRYASGIEYQSGTPLALPAALALDFPQIQSVATVFGGYNNQIDVMEDNGQAVAKRFKVENGVFYTNPAFFEVFQFKWLAGNPAEVLAQPNKAAITREIAETYFGTWQNAIGKTIRKDNNETLEVAGILENPPVNTDFPLKVVVSYLTFQKGDYARPILQDWGTVSTRSQCFVMLRDQKDEALIAAGMPAFKKKHLEAGNTTDFYSLQSLRDVHFNERYGNFNLHTVSRSSLLALSLIGVFLLALACINFINLATAQAVKRSREVGIRKVLGSRRWQLGIQFLGETFVIVLAAAVLATLLLTVLSPVTGQLLERATPLNPFQSPITMVFMGVIVVAVTLFSGLYPALVVSGYKPIQALKNKLATQHPAGISLRRVLVVVQFVIAQALIIATLVIISQIHYFHAEPLGFNKDAVITVSLPRDSTSRAKWDAFRRELQQLPGIEHVSLSYSAPASQSSHSTDFRFNQETRNEGFEINLKSADTGYFETYHLQLLAGHLFAPSDTAREVVVNETFLKKQGLHNFQETVGKYILIDRVKMPIAGLVKDFHQSSLRDPIDPIFIVPQKRDYRIAGIRIQPAQLTASVQRISQLFNRTFPEYLFEYQFLDESVARFYTQEQKLSGLFQLFAVIGIFISCIGLYGLILFMTIQRIREVGIRKILGGSVFHIVMLFFKEFIWLIAIAFVVAASLAWYFMNGWLNDFAYHIKISWWMFASVGLASLLLAMLTVSVQTIRAAMANPVKSLRTE